MKVLFYVPRMNRMGGSIRTTLAFMDTFKQLGCKVKLWTDIDHNIKYYSSIDQQLEHSGFKYITSDDILLNNNGLFQPDLVFCRGTHNYLFNSRKTKSIIWIISNFDKVNAANIQHRWTNSFTTAEVCGIRGKYDVVYPPHDYSLFRQHSRPFEERDIDFVTIGRMNAWKEKGMDVFEHYTKTLGLNSVMISTANTESDYDFLENLTTPVAPNQDRKGVAEILGRTKFLLFPSRIESCPLVVYEAMNAGCIPISRNVGAVKEQLGGLGYTFGDDYDIPDLTEKAMSETHDVEQYMERGIKFDRINSIPKIKELLNI